MGKIKSGDVLRLLNPSEAPVEWLSVVAGQTNILLDASFATGSAWEAKDVGGGKFSLRNPNGSTAQFLDISSAGAVFLNDDAVDASTHWKFEASATAGLCLLTSHFGSFLTAGQGGDLHKVLGDSHPEIPQAQWAVLIDAEV